MKTVAILGLLLLVLHPVFGEKTAEEEVRDSLVTGDVCPDFRMENIDRKEVKFSSLRGKYVYIDVWASWCYPCRQQFPFLKELEEEVNSDEIVYVGVNVDTQVYRWIGDVDVFKLKGEQWHILDEEFENKFQVHYIPRFMLLDKDGKILEMKMTAPSKEETKVYLKKLVKTNK